MKKFIQKIKDKTGMSTAEFVICMLIFIMVTAFIIDLFIVSYKHYEVSANCTKTARVIAIQGGLDNECPENYPGGNSNYMTNREFKTYLDELANQVQGDVGEFNVYIDYSYIDNYDNVIKKEKIHVYKFSNNANGTVTKTYYPQKFLLPYGSVINLTFEYTYEFFYTNRWFEDIARYKFHSSKSNVTEYVSYDYGYHINGNQILTIIEDLPPLNVNISSGLTATDAKYFIHSGNAILGLSEEGIAANLTDIVIPSNINGQVITKIAAGAFKENTRIQTLILPANIKHIEAEAFLNCSKLHTIRYFEGLERIDAMAFAGCTALKNFTPSYSYEKLGVADSMILPNSLQEIHDLAFENCSSIVHIRMGKNIVKIAPNAFNGVAGGAIMTITIAVPRNTDADGNWVYAVLDAPWRQVQDASGNWVPDTVNTKVNWGTKRG